MAKVTGVGGVFFKSKDPERSYEWYEKHLGIKRIEGGIGLFTWREDDNPDKKGMTVWSHFPDSSDYFGDSRSNVMINYRVDDIDALLASLERSGVKVLGREDSDFGKFAWINDPDGNRIELWEPPADN